MKEALIKLKANLKGEIFYDSVMRSLYATDASAYRELPLAVAYPADSHDISQLIEFAQEHGSSLIPRAAGTSLAGQVVGSGIVLDISRHFTQILEVNKEEKWVRVEPGVIRDDLNKYLEPYGLFFGPETSTANRAMIGGMLGNNSCGANSIAVGSTREHVLEVRGFLSDGSEVSFSEISPSEFEIKCENETREGEVYRQFREILQNEGIKERIRREFPKPEIRRRNTGYAVDMAMDSTPFNFCKLIAGSEGTLMVVTEIKLGLLDLPPREKGVVVVHTASIDEATQITLKALEYKPWAVELIDDIILECTKTNIEQRKNRSFVEGDPKALVVIEVAHDNREDLETELSSIVDSLKTEDLGYHHPVLVGNEINKVWTLRKAGLGLLSNLPGDAKPVPCIEDTAVSVNDLREYLGEFQEILDKYRKECVYYAHIGAGEIHLRPVLNLKDPGDRQIFHDITDEVASLVKKYHGSLSGEHGDGRVRGVFIRKMVGEENFNLLKEIKQTWDPDNIFNPGKIVDTPAMNESLRYESGQETKEFSTVLNFSDSGGILRMTEKCNGSGDCRKTQVSGGTMCPSYMATRDEKDTTRARANLMREIMTRSPDAFGNDDVQEILDLCLSCKGCKSECPSNVDVAKLKAEFNHQYQKKKGTSFRTRMIAGSNRANLKLAGIPWVYNLFARTWPLSAITKAVMGFAGRRPLPAMSPLTLKKWHEREAGKLRPEKARGQVFLFCDEFTNFYDVEIGKKAVLLLSKLGYEVLIPDHLESGRTYISKGLLDEARSIATDNVKQLISAIGDTPLLGIEPSAILTLRDEYPDLVPAELREDARKLAGQSFLIDEFLDNLISAGEISSDQFTAEPREISLHGHCHQKALSSSTHSANILSLPANFKVNTIPSGCCGMAGSFGYEKEHYDLSMRIGELVLFPAVRDAGSGTLIAAPGTSCRHQIMDGTGRRALHPVEILYDALA